MEELDFYIKGMRDKYASVLAYFGEDPAMNVQDFFTTLRRFMTDFVDSREVVERQKRAEERREREAARKAAAAAAANGGTSSAVKTAIAPSRGAGPARAFDMRADLAAAASVAAGNNPPKTTNKPSRRASVM